MAARIVVPESVLAGHVTRRRDETTIVLVTGRNCSVATFREVLTA